VLHKWIYYDGRPKQGMRLQATIREPHGFDDWTLDTPVEKARYVSPPLPPAIRVPAEHGVAPPFTNRFVRVTAMAARLCDGVLLGDLPRAP
jgi:hypothetical protein